MDTNNLPDKLAELLEDFSLLQDQTERIEMLIFYADQFQEVPERLATRPFPEERRVPACESEAYVWSEKLDDGTLKFYFAVENPQGISAKAMAEILDETVSGAPLEQVVKLNEEIVYALFGKGISMGKGMGLKSMVNIVKSHAFQEIAKQ